MITFTKYTNIEVCVFDKNLLKIFLCKYDKYDAISFNIITSYHCDSLYLSTLPHFSSMSWKQCWWLFYDKKKHIEH